MRYINLRECLKDLSDRGWLLEIKEPLDPILEIPFVQREVLKNQGPAIYFSNPKGCRFPLVSNLFGTKERVRHIFRDGLKILDKIFNINLTLKDVVKELPTFLKALWLSKPKIVENGPVLGHEASIMELPQLKFWPKDGGCFITLPQVYSEDPEQPGIFKSNLGMYRIQISGNQYTEGTIGLHYQIHRGIGRHHLKAILMRRNLKVNIFIGGPPAMIIAAVMPLPENFPEILFANLLAGYRIPLIKQGMKELPIPAEADFCIQGEVPYEGTLPEGPFGDHLGYYSLKHLFPILKVKRVVHRDNAIWSFTSVGRPPQEDSIIGEFIHEIFGPMIRKTFPGIVDIHAVDASGVHPLLLAIGREGYVPFSEERVPQEILTQAFHLLGNTQTSLSKYLFIAAYEDDPTLTTRDIPRFFDHILRRVDLRRDLHFITRTTMDTLDYSGISLNQGSKLILAASGKPIRDLATDLPNISWPNGFKNPGVFAKGILVVEGPRHDKPKDTQDPMLKDLETNLVAFKSLLKGFPWIVIVDDVEFTCKSWDNFLWVVFTRSDPATDIYGIESFTNCKHWGCDTTMIIDARLKKHYAPVLEDDPGVVSKIKELAKSGGPLAGVVKL